MQLNIKCFLALLFIILGNSFGGLFVPFIRKVIYEESI